MVFIPEVSKKKCVLALPCLYVRIQKKSIITEGSQYFSRICVLNFVTFEVLTAVLLKIRVFLDVMLVVLCVVSFVLVG
jgi:hypothetical protein